MNTRPLYPRRTYLIKESMSLGLPQDLAQELEFEGVPESFIGRFQSAERLSYCVDRYAPRGLVRFGTGLNYERLCLDPKTGRVVSVPATEGETRLVNSSLERFTSIVESMLELVPFYVEDAESGEVERAQAACLNIVRRIDPPAAAPDLFWTTFVDDVGVGDFVHSVAPPRLS